MSVTFDTDNGDTYVIRLANPAENIAVQVATILGEHGDNLVHGEGLWNGNVEPDVSITIQCTPHILQVLVSVLSTFYPNEEYLHVERHSVPTSYVDMAELRRQF